MKGTYYKKKTKDFYVREGYQVEYLEKLLHIFDKKKKKTFYIKRDLFASDILAVNDAELLFINVTTKDNLASHVKRFKEITIPDCPFIKQLVLYWEPRAKEPVIVDVASYKEVD